MIKFKKLSYKNFLSTGNAGITIFLDRSPTTLMTGVSGSGKSTFIDALCFGLYGKPFRNINKPRLINSINGKNLEVEVEFEINGRQYKIVRGMKPNKFDIFIDNKLLTQDAATRDYQKVLEEQILQMTFKTFCQIVVLGSVDYTPFMQLPAATRREVVENILDINVFSNMNLLLKQQIQETKDKLLEVDSEIKTLKERAEGLKRLIETLSEKRDEHIVKINTELNNIKKEIEQKENEIAEKQEKVKQFYSLSKKKLEELNLIEKGLNDKIAQITQSIKENNNNKEFFSEKDQCPVCRQNISNEHKHNMINDIESKLQTLEQKQKEYKKYKETIQEKIAELSKRFEEIEKLNREISALETTINMLKNRQASFIQELTELTNHQKDIEEPKSELKQIAKKILEFMEKKKELTEKRQIQENAAILLKDSGIKTAIIREYLPLINKYLNKYLSELQMDVEFTLDEQFNEIVKSRYRDEFEYGNFSTGEKTRIDVALMMTWRKIASLKNSASTNLLIVDEILSGGTLDSANLDIMIDMINTLAREGNNIFIIAHGDHLIDKFKNLIRFEKIGNFSVMT